MPDIDTKLASKLKQATSNRMCFAFVTKGGVGKLVVDKKKVSARDIADAKKEIGGGTIFTGRCLGAEGTLVFETTKDAPGSIVTLLKKTIKTDAGMTVTVEMRVNASAESQGEEEQELESEESSPQQTVPLAPPVPTPNTGAKTMKRLNGLTAEIKAALVGPNAAEVKKLFGSLNDLLRKKDFDAVEKVLDELEALIRGK
jgi:hypothetical protein